MLGFEFVRKDIRKAMQKFRKTQGLIIDVRGNSGGSRDILRTLFPFFMTQNSPIQVVNVAAYRLHELDPKDDSEGYLWDRHLYPINSPRWNAEEKKALSHFAKTFKPEWIPPEDQFSQWHYFAIKRNSSADYYHYQRPVVILMDSRCFSATDIFLGAFKGHPKVTLLGTPSSGGSGRSRKYFLHESRIMVKLSSMASFRSNGRLYDGRGIQPDVLVRPKATDIIRKTDSALEKALALFTQ